MKLLIADDNAAVRALIVRVCAGFASDIRECADGLEAIASFSDFQPDWVLMDLDMPGLDGLRATRELRLQFPSARIVIVTQHRDLAYREAARDAGATAYVLKSELASLKALLCQTPLCL